MQVPYFPFLIVLITLTISSPLQNTTVEHSLGDPVTKMKMSLSAFGVEDDDFPSIDVYIDFIKDSSNCTRRYYNPGRSPASYKLSHEEIERVLGLINSVDLFKLKSSYNVSKTDQPTSTATICFGQKTLVIEDYGLQADYPLQAVYKIVYKL